MKESYYEKEMWQNSLDYITTLEKVAIYHTIFSNKEGHIITRLKTILKKISFRKPLNMILKVPLIFFPCITK